MKKYTKAEMKMARVRHGRLTEMMMLIHNERIDEQRAAKKQAINKHNTKGD